MKSGVCPSLLAAISLAASCGPLMRIESVTVGDFCDVANPIQFESADVADHLAKDDRLAFERIAAHNLYGEAKCGWEFQP